MIEILLFFIGASLLLYVIFGGADYGAGILELFPADPELKEQRKNLINHAMGPVWEANHIWLILVVVILFMAFPFIFTTLMTTLHLPMVFLLLGIVVRGTAFTFRHYDAVQEERSQKIYTWLFSFSSLWTAFWLGVIVASLNRGLIDPEVLDFKKAYIDPWWGLHPFVTGLFVVFIFAFLASIYLVGESQQPGLRRYFLSKGILFNILTVLTGGLVFATASLENLTWPLAFFQNIWTLLCLAGASFLFVILWSLVRRSQVFWLRVTAAGQVSLILLGWYILHAPDVMQTQQGPISFYETAAPPATLWQLVLALLVGSLFIFPSLIYLLKIFKSK